MKLSIVFPVMNQFPLAQTAIEFAIKNLSAQEDVEVIILDNGSDTPFLPYGEREVKIPVRGDFELTPQQEDQLPNWTPISVLVRTIRLDKNIGVYPTFWEALKHTTGDVIAFLHSDTIISEKGWDYKMINVFKSFPSIGLVGFIGSNEIDASGGRGLGTTSNFQGLGYSHGGMTPVDFNNPAENFLFWRGSPAEVHGRRNGGFTMAAVVDGCAMVFRREVLEKVKQRDNFPPHHFYDRLLSCETREAGYAMGVIGIEFDHISGQTVNQEPAYGVMAQKWAEVHGLSMNGFHNWDTVLYKEAERLWLSEYRDQKHLVPCKV